MSADVVFVLGRWARGGTELQAIELVCSLRDRGLSVALVVVEDGVLPDVSGVPVITMGARRGLRGAPTLLRAALRLRRYVRRQSPRVVHSAMARGYIVTALALRRGGPKVVSWRRNVGTHLLGRSGLWQRLDRWAARRADLVIVNSVAVRDYWRSVCGAGVDIEVVPNSVDDRFFNVIPSNCAAPRLVSVGALKQVKAHETLIDACAGLARLGRAAELVLVGDGPRRAHLEAHAQDLGVELAVTGVVDDVVPHLASAKVYVHSSTSEGVSNAIIEAMATGLPVVVPDILGMAGFVGEAGRLYIAGDVADLVSVLDGLLGDDAECTVLGRAARRRAANHRDRSITDRYIDLYGVSDLCAV